VKEVGSGASERQVREKLLEAARRREIDVVLVWRLDRWGRSVADLLAALQELQHLGVGFVSLTEGWTSRHWPVAPWPRYWQYSQSSKGRFCENGCALAWPTPGKTVRHWAGRRPRRGTLLKSASYIAPASSKAEIARRLQIGRTSVRRILG
jgi:putative DNA-invertase from lambdoid prophage Rac